jgi:4-hydroxyphenylpyruvate dioxygenase-like putative hemolysin
MQEDSMKFAYALIPLAAFAFVADASAQARIWRCGNSNYTNDEAQAKAQNCKLVEGGNVTVVQGTKVNGAGKDGARGHGAAVAPAGQKVDSVDQKARDAEARSILEAELKKAETRQADCRRNTTTASPRCWARNTATTRNTSIASPT